MTEITLEDIRELIVKPLVEKQNALERQIEAHSENSQKTALQIARIEVKLNNGIYQKITNTETKVDEMYSAYIENKFAKKKNANLFDWIKTIAAAVIGAVFSKIF